MMLRKSLAYESCDLKFSSEGEGIFEGYLSTFNNVDSYGDTVLPGAYKATLEGRKRMPPMFLNHDQMSVPIGVWKDMREDDVGLRVVGELTPGNAKAQEVHASMKHGALSGLSIGYVPKKFEKNEHGGLDLIEINLREGSVVTVPAEDTARIDVVKFDDYEITSTRDFEWLLRDVGFTQMQAKTLVSKFRQTMQRDVDESLRYIKQLEAELDFIKGRKASEKRQSNIGAKILTLGKIE